MSRIVTLCGTIAVSFFVTGCVPTGAVPSIGQQVAAAEAAGYTVETTATGDQSLAAQCKNAELVKRQLATAGIDPASAAQGALGPEGC